jgi:hypothetical protein
LLVPEWTPPKQEPDKGALEYPHYFSKEQQQDDAAVGAVGRRCEEKMNQRYRRGLRSITKTDSRDDRERAGGCSQCITSNAALKVNRASLAHF